MHFSPLSSSAVILIATLSNAAPVTTIIPGVNITSTNAAAENLIPNSWFLVYTNGTSDADFNNHIQKIHTKLGKTPSSTFNLNGFKAILMDTDATGLAQIGTDAVIDHVEYNVQMSLDPMLAASAVTKKTSPAPIKNSNQLNAPWGLSRISHKNLGKYTDYLYDSSACDGTVAYVLDTGIMDTDIEGHGTHCAGIVIGEESGVCKFGEAVAVKHISTPSKRAKLHKSVQTISIAGPYSPMLNALVNAVVLGGMPVVVSAGNQGADASDYSPGSALDSMTTGAIDQNDNRPNWSNWGPSVYIFAPGVDIESTWITCDTCYLTQSGTSMAAPHMAGLAMYFMAKENLVIPMTVIQAVIGAASVGLVGNPQGSYNKIGYNADGA
ncbi:subtilisin-like protein [Mollisia scopiformis]|uniref:Subtilisin-like protein n=1 Tax=Mollisia scopiformis TaxID=149040 RepID=A0A194X1N9_MOLSC|nr:subtilisin-like protein [Mollisia scopiformis]KUJ14110.1 subtilisin-like protein [Mollisia scopiformis]